MGLTWVEEWTLYGGVVSEVSRNHRPFAWAVAVVELRVAVVSQGC